MKGLTQKAAQGGTINRAPIGYVNIGVRDERGRESRTVEIDEERARHITWAFQVYASGRWTLSQIHRELISRGLTTLPTPKRPSKPIAISTLYRLLSNPNYKGDVTFKGATYKGNHEAIVPKEVWHQVQAVLDAHKSAADATQVHEHYLKGTVFCGHCGERLIITNAKNRHGNVYPYFVCSGRHSGKTECTRQAMLIEDVERLIEKYYEMIEVSPGMRQDLAGKIHADFDLLMANETKELSRLTSERDRLDDERMKLLQAHYAGTVPIDLLKQEQDRIADQIGDIQHRIEAHHDEYASARANLDDSLKLLSNAADISEHTDDANRRLLNQALFKAIYIDEDNDVRVGYRTPYDGLSVPDFQADALTRAADAQKAQKKG